MSKIKVEDSERIESLQDEGRSPDRFESFVKVQQDNYVGVSPDVDGKQLQNLAKGKKGTEDGLVEEE